MSRRIRPPNIAESALLASALAIASSCSDHHVSPWGDATGPTLRPFLPKPDLAARLAEIDAETSDLGLSREREISGELPRGGGPIVVRSYAGHDAARRAVHAVRVASSRGVVMAVGPLDARDLGREKATELVQGFPEEDSPYRPLVDLNHDGSPDILLKNEAGSLEVWGIAGTGANPYPIEMAARPTSMTDVDGDGLLDFVGVAAPAALPEGDPLAPLLEDVATFDGRGYSPRTRGALAFHERQIEALDTEASAEAAALGDAGAPDGGAADAGLPAKIPDRVRLRRAIMRAWHSLLAGHARESVMKTLDRELVPAALRQSFEAYRRSLDRLPNRTPREEKRGM